MGALEIFIFISSVCLVSSEVISRDVVLDQGTVRGYNDDNEDVFSYYGIPYASAPQGEDRFKAPLPGPTWDGVFNATTRNIVCPQRQPFVDTSQELIRTLDCLRINVFSPVRDESDDTKLPVIVYIYGGGFQEGYGKAYGSVGFAAKGIVAVNFNYRVGAHGFLCLGTEFAPGNAGLKDQSAALRWVQNNIAQFGGDPDNVLIAGSSAGSFAAEYQMLSPMSDGLFHKLALESGSAFTFLSYDVAPLGVAETFAQRFGVETGGDVQQLEEFYKSLTDEQLNEGWNAIGMNIGFRACVETHNLEGVEKFLEALPSDIARSGDYEKRPVLSGFTTMEGLGMYPRFESLRSIIDNDFSELLPFDLSFESDSERQEITQKVRDFYFPSGEITDEGLIDFCSDSVFGYPHIVSARQHIQNSVPVFLYLWSFNGTVNLPYMATTPIWGPGHIMQTLYLFEFDNPAIYDNMTAEDYRIQEQIQEVYINFVKYGEPIPSRTELLDVEWPPVTPEALNYLNFDSELSLRQSPLRERFDFWDEIYGYQ